MPSRKHSRSVSSTSSLYRFIKRQKISHAHPVTLENLSVELIEEIFALLPQATLYQVAQVSRQFYVYAEDVLYRHPLISTKNKGSARKLCDTLLERKDLAETVRTVEFHIGRCAGKRCGPPTANAKTPSSSEDNMDLVKSPTHSTLGRNSAHSLRGAIMCDTKYCGSILGLCTGLQRLSVTCVDVSWDHLFAPLLDRANTRFRGLDHVTHLTLKQDRMVFADRTSLVNPNVWPMLLAFLKLPSLRSLSINKIEAIAAPHVDSYTNVARTSSLCRLELEDCVSRPAALHALLRHTPYLTSLRMSIPHHYPNQYASHVAFSPWESLPFSLAPVKHSLQHLKFDARSVWRHYQAWWQQKLDLEPIGSLEGFVALTKLSISRNALLGSRLLDEDDIWHRLPCGLREVVVLHEKRKTCLVR